MEIIFIAVATEEPSGGVKVIYQNCETLIKQGIKCEILHSNNPEARCNWIEYDVQIRNTLSVNPASDFIVIPEGAAGKFGKQCLLMQCKYAIYVQNGYQIYNDVNQSNRIELEKIYQNASIILSISDDTTSAIKYQYPNVDPNKILRVYPPINKNLFFIERRKSKKIGIMPRKLGLHAYLIRYFVESYLPTGWEIVSIENKTEIEVSEILRECSIFISLSDMEGFGLPPLEAAFCGCLVVGYTGQGGKEYFSKPIFRDVEHGNFIDFSNKILGAIKDIENGILETRSYKDHLKLLESKYSQIHCADALVNFAKRVDQLALE